MEISNKECIPTLEEESTTLSRNIGSPLHKEGVTSQKNVVNTRVRSIPACTSGNNTDIMLATAPTDAGSVLGDRYKVVAVLFCSVD